MNVQLEKEHVGEGLETAGLPEGMLSLPEFLLEYCSASVRPATTTCNVNGICCLCLLKF